MVRSRWRRPRGALVAVVALALIAEPAAAQTPEVPAPPPPRVGPVTSEPAAGPGVEEQAYDPAKHDGWSEGAWLRATRGTERRSTAMLATGITLLILGASLVGTGIGVAATGSSCDHQMIFASGTEQTICGARSGPSVGAAVYASGFIALGLGLPLTILGASEVPRAEAARSAPKPRPFDLALGLRGATITIKF